MAWTSRSSRPTSPAATSLNTEVPTAASITSPVVSNAFTIPPKSLAGTTSLGKKYPAKRPAKSNKPYQKSSKKHSKSEKQSISRGRTAHGSAITSSATAIRSKQGKASSLPEQSDGRPGFESSATTATRKTNKLTSTTSSSSITVTKVKTSNRKHMTRPKKTTRSTSQVVSVHTFSSSSILSTPTTTVTAEKPKMKSGSDYGWLLPSSNPELNSSRTVSAEREVSTVQRPAPFAETTIYRIKPSVAQCVCDGTKGDPQCCVQVWKTAVKVVPTTYPIVIPVPVSTTIYGKNVTSTLTQQLWKTITDTKTFTRDNWNTCKTTIVASKTQTLCKDWPKVKTVHGAPQPHGTVRPLVGVPEVPHDSDFGYGRHPDKINDALSVPGLKIPEGCPPRYSCQPDNDHCLHKCAEYFKDCHGGDQCHANWLGCYSTCFSENSGWNHRDDEKYNDDPDRRPRHGHIHKPHHHHLDEANTLLQCHRNCDPVKSRCHVDCNREYNDNPNNLDVVIARSIPSRGEVRGSHDDATISFKHPYREQRTSCARGYSCQRNGVRRPDSHYESHEPEPPKEFVPTSPPSPPSFPPQSPEEHPPVPAPPGQPPIPPPRPLSPRPLPLPTFSKPVPHHKCNGTPHGHGCHHHPLYHGFGTAGNWSNPSTVVKSTGAMRYELNWPYWVGWLGIWSLYSLGGALLFCIVLWFFYLLDLI